MQATEIDSWKAVCDESLSKKDRKFKVYLGLSASEDEPAADASTHPPQLDIHFVRETWYTPGANIEEYKLAACTRGARGPWWAGFAPEEVDAGDDVTYVTCVTRPRGSRCR